MSTMKFCRECNNILYPKEDKERKVLLFACRNCYHQEVADYSCVYRNEVHHTASERTQVLQDVAADPTLPRTKAVKCSKCNHPEAAFFQVFMWPDWRLLLRRGHGVPPTSLILEQLPSLAAAHGYRRSACRATAELDMDQKTDIEIPGKEGLHDRSSVQLLTTLVAEEPAALLTEALGVTLRAPRLLEFWSAARTPPPEPVHLEPRQSKNQQRAAAGVFACAGLQPSNKRTSQICEGDHQFPTSQKSHNGTRLFHVALPFSITPAAATTTSHKLFHFLGHTDNGGCFTVKRRTSRRGPISIPGKKKKVEVFT
ncbi:hypothetical protein C4D60_Mb04t20930 [Musa balbisiana]|uniref:DNA-directed RNA polymerase II subunit RPB9-like zinc ribbon domain-containing protein n=1 Tax=Musa balbisiana TaxID=52838 RepID=A0A4S8KDL8_MUSBA|nr:hypothetical protein C4D60_Mb04t20930 [Musa balbisiana]